MADDPAEIRAGRSYTIKIPIQDRDGTYPDLSGAKGRWWLARGSGGSEILLKKSSFPGEEGGLSFVSTVQGQITIWSMLIVLEPEDTRDVTPSPPQGWMHEAELVDADGNYSTVKIGPFKILPTIVRP